MRKPTRLAVLALGSSALLSTAACGGNDGAAAKGGGDSGNKPFKVSFANFTEAAPRSG